MVTPDARRVHEIATMQAAAQPEPVGKREQIRASLEAYVQEAEPGALIPSERALATQFQVARMTVRAAIDSLESMGLIRRAPGRGAFVQHPLLAQPDVLRSFSEDMAKRGMSPGTTGFKARVLEADVFLAERLGITPGEDVCLIERVRTADGVPMAIERINIAAGRFPGLLARIDADASVYDVLATAYGVRVETAEQTVSIAQLDTADARRLGAAAGDPCFAVVQSSFDARGDVVEFGRSLYRGDRYAIQLHVHKAHDDAAG